MSKHKTKSNVFKKKSNLHCLYNITNYFNKHLNIINVTMHTLVLSHKCFLSYFGVVYISKEKMLKLFAVSEILEMHFYPIFLSSGASLL